MTAQRDIQFLNTERESLRLTDDELEHFRKKFGMTVKGANVPYPFLKVSEAEFPDVLHKIVTQKMHKGLSPLEGQVWSTLKSGRDTVVTSVDYHGQVGTNLFLPPAVAHALNEEQSSDDGNPIVLILCDNKNNQNNIRHNCSIFYDKISYPKPRHGNTNQEDKLFLFASPNGLLKLLDNKKVTLDRCNYVILYNLSWILDKTYVPQVRKVLKKFLTKPQIVILTLQWNVLMQSLADEILSNYVIISTVLYPAVKTLSFSNSPKLKQEFLEVKKTDKYNELKKIIENCMQNKNCKIVVYAGCVNTVNNVSSFLNKLNYFVGHIHVGTNTHWHRRVLANFETKPKYIVVLDKFKHLLKVGDIDYAINYDFPSIGKFYRSRIETIGAFRVTTAVYNFMTIDDHLNLDFDFWTLLYQKDGAIMQSLKLLMEEKEQPEHAELLKYFQKGLEEINLNEEYVRD